MPLEVMNTKTLIGSFAIALTLGACASPPVATLAQQVAVVPAEVGASSSAPATGSVGFSSSAPVQLVEYWKLDEKKEN